MEEEIQKNIKKEENSNKGAKKARTFIYFLIGSLILLQLLVFLLIFLYDYEYFSYTDPKPFPFNYDNQSSEEEQTPGEETLFEETITYTNDEENFSFTLPIEWKMINDSTTYDYISDKQVTYESSIYGCKIIYGVIEKDILLTKPYAQESISEEKLILSLPMVAVPADDEVNSENQYMNINTLAAPNFPYITSKYGLVLLRETNTSLPRECETLFYEILSTRTIEYEKVILTNQSTGLLYFEDEYGSSQRILFLEKESGKEQALTENFYSKEFIYWMDPFSPQLVGTEIYFQYGSTEDPIIKKINLSTGKVTDIDLIYEKAKPVHSFFVEGNMLYYLSGKFCNEYMGSCNLDLKGFELSTGDTLVLATGLVSRQILGFDATKENLILQHSEGDALDSWGTFEQFNLETNKASTLLNYSYSTSDDPNDSDGYYDENSKLEAEKAKQIRDSVIGMDYVPYIIFTDGNISFPSEKDNWYKYFNLSFIKVNTNQLPIHM